jgi:hypothetical protein
MQREDLPDLYVLDTVADDAKNLETILQVLNGDGGLAWHRRWGRKFAREEIVESIARLIAAEKLRAAVLSMDGRWLEELHAGQLPVGRFEDAWFAITPRGRLVHANWDPGDLSDMSPGP